MSEPLIGVDTLAGMIEDPRLRLADVRWSLDDPAAGPAAYRAGHLPGAVYVHLEEHLSRYPGAGRHPLPERRETAETLGMLGFGDDHIVVAYDDQGGAIAARLWWMLRDLGHRAVSVLDGGIDAWRESGRVLAREVPHHPPARVSIRPPLTRSIDRTSLHAALGSVVLLDARAPERYRGDEEPIDPVAGHIPSARNAPYAENLDATGRFLAPHVLADRYRALGAESDTVVYCGSGVTACHDVLAMIVAGVPEPILYPGSWSDWCSEEMPVAVGD